MLLIVLQREPSWELDRSRDENVKNLVRAVIQVRESDAGTERCVIGYHDERTLRQLLAERSIVATGFSSRDEATKQSFTAGIGHRSPFLNVVSRVRPSPGFCQLRI